VNALEATLFEDSIPCSTNGADWRSSPCLASVRSPDIYVWRDALDMTDGNFERASA